MENILFYELGKCFGVKYSSFSNQVRSLRDKSVAKVFTKAFLKVKSNGEGKLYRGSGITELKKQIMNYAVIKPF